VTKTVNVLDASAILAYLQQEPGEDIVETALDRGPSHVTSVNYCEVLGKLREKGMPADEATTAADELGLTVIDFDKELARLAADLRPRTLSIGASLGDRACLALAQHAAQTDIAPVVYTAERAWTKLDWPFEIILIRPLHK
jgi:PIN domain nuclease of toxin-antitoxin system